MNETRRWSEPDTIKRTTTSLVFEEEPSIRPEHAIPFASVTGYVSGYGKDWHWHIQCCKTFGNMQRRPTVAKDTACSMEAARIACEEAYADFAEGKTRLQCAEKCCSIRYACPLQAKEKQGAAT